VTTVEDKLKLFAKIIFEKVEKDSEEKIIEFTKSHDEILEKEKENVLKESESMIKQMRKKAESKRQQIISKANIDKQHALLKKRKELFDRAVDDIRNIASDFTNSPEYLSYLEKSIESSLSKIDTTQIVIYIKSNDMGAYNKKIQYFIDKYKKAGVSVMIEEAKKGILGGCICEDENKTMRVDCSMASAIEDNKGLIGKVLMDNLQ